MGVTATNISGLYIIDGLKFNDHRGCLIKPFSDCFFYEVHGININFKETWFTKSHIDVIRGMHLQAGEFACEKIVSVIHGSVLDVILDLRKNSVTFGQWFDIELNDEKSISLYIPKGCAHGYKVLKDNTITMYMATEVNVPKDDIGIKWDSFGYYWNIDRPLLSPKDKGLPLFGEYFYEDISGKNK